MKFLFFTDSHIRGTTPKNRKDNFYETLKNKFQEILELVEKFQVDYVLHGGDWFDRPDVSPAIVREFAILLKQFKRPIFTVAGNHDIYGHNPDTVGRTMLGLLEGIGILKLIGMDDKIILESDKISVQLTGKPYHYDIDGEDYKKYYLVQKDSKVDYAINIVHGMLLQKPFFEGVRCTLIEDIKETEADITLVGHYHSGFGVRTVNSRCFINPGSLVRIANTMSEINRKPKVVLIELDEQIRIKEIELQCALPGDTILDRTQLEISADRNIKLHEFYKGIAATGEYKKVDLNSIIEEIASNQDLSESVKHEAVRRIALAREKLALGDDDT